MLGLSSANPRRLWIKYIAALSFILFLLVGSHLAHLISIKDASVDSSIVNISGQQRMLSQRIAYFAERQFKSDSDIARPELLKQYKNAIQMFTSNHDWIITNAVRSEAAEQMYFGDEGANLDRQSKLYTALARRLLEPSLQSHDQNKTILLQIEAMASDIFLRKLDNAVTLFVTESKSKSANMELLQLIALLIAIITIVAEALLIFLPAQRSINTALDQAEDSMRSVEERNSDLEIITSKLDYAAYHDQLTGLKNRRAFEEDIDFRISNLQSGFHMYVLQFDLDGFKQVNDNLGHPVGDMVLKHVSKIMSSLCRDCDTVARIGGDEFIILLDMPAYAGTQRVQELAEGIISGISEPMDIDGDLITIGASAGYAAAKTSSINPTVLVSNADVALYVSKRNGKGVATLFLDDMRKEMNSHSTLTNELMRALEENEFVPFFQPQVSFHDGQVVGFEVLGRWNHPDRGILSPAEFIPFAEKIGLIDQIDNKITQAGLDGLALLRAEGWDIPKISINMSSRSLRSPAFCTDLLKSLSIRGLLPSDVLVEVLETSLIECSGDQAVKTVSELSKSGFGIAIDDFGTGYASLAMVATLDISELKIDRSLVEGMESPKGRKIIEAIIALSKEMNLTVVAEGIETSAQFATLKGFGCDVAQGYKIGYPLSQTETSSWFSTYGKMAPTGCLASAPISQI